MNIDKKEVNVLDLLLSAPMIGLPEKQIKVKRLCQQLGQDVVFKLRGLSYNRVAEIREIANDAAIHIVLAGVVEPSLKDERLLGKYSAITPEDLLKNPAFLLPGEVADLSREIERLSGYKKDTLEELKKN